MEVEIITLQLAIIHTTPLTVEPLKALANELIPHCEIMNMVDDSILPELKSNGGDVEAIGQRWTQYAEIAQAQGAHCILNACSSIGELVDRFQPSISIPIVRIDAPMADYAVHTAQTIGVAATLETTLQPTLRMLQQKAVQAGKAVTIQTMLAATAYEKLLAGDQAGHDQELARALRQLSEQTELVVLAQASMARVLSSMTPEEQSRFISSPRLGMQRAASLLLQSKEN